MSPGPSASPHPPVCTNLISRSIKQELEKLQRTGRLRRSGATSSRPFQLACAASARAAVKRWTRLAEVVGDEVDPRSVYQPEKIEEPRKLGADLPVLKPATPTPTPTPAPPAPVAPVPPRSKPGRGGWRVRLGSSWARSDGRFRWLPQLP